MIDLPDDFNLAATSSSIASPRASARRSRSASAIAAGPTTPSPTKIAQAGRRSSRRRRAPRRARPHRAARRAAVRVGVLRDARARRRRRDGQPARAAREPRVPRRRTRARPRSSPCPRSPRRFAPRSSRRARQRGAARSSSCPTPRPATTPRRRSASRLAATRTFARARARARRRDARPSSPPVHRDEPAIWLFTAARPGEPKANDAHATATSRSTPRSTRSAPSAIARDDVTVSVPRLFFGYATGTNLMFPFAVGATVGALQRAPDARGARERDRDVPARPSSPTCRRCSASSSSTTTRSRATGKPGLDLSSVRFSLSAGEALPEPLLARWLERFAQRRLRRHRLGRDVPHLRLEPPRRHQAGLARQGRRGLRAARSCPRRPRAPARAPLRARRDRRALGEGRQRRARLLARSRQELEDVPRPLVPHRRSLPRRRARATCTSQGAPTISSRSAASGSRRSRSRSACSSTPRSPLCAVIGVEDEGLVKPKAFVVLRAGVTRDAPRSPTELQEHVEATLAKHKYPRVVEFVDDLPKNDRGKVDKKALRARAARRRSRRDGARASPSSRTTRSRRSAPPGRAVALVPVGSVEPHGPHLPLATDTIISETCARARRRRARGATACARVVAPRVPYGVTDYARGLRGRDRRPGGGAHARSSRAIATASSPTGFAHVCLVNNHLEPAHDAAVRAAIDGLPDGRGVGRVPAHAPLGAHALRRVQARRLPRRSLRDVARLAAGGARARRRSARCRRSGSASPTRSRPARRRSPRSAWTRAYTGAPREATRGRGRGALREARHDGGHRDHRSAGRR